MDRARNAVKVPLALAALGFALAAAGGQGPQLPLLAGAAGGCLLVAVLLGGARRWYARNLVGLALLVAAAAPYLGGALALPLSWFAGNEVFAPTGFIIGFYAATAGAWVADPAWRALVRFRSPFLGTASDVEWPFRGTVSDEVLEARSEVRPHVRPPEPGEPEAADFLRAQDQPQDGAAPAPGGSP